MAGNYRTDTRPEPRETGCGNDATGRQGSGCAGRLAILAMIVLVLGPLLWLELPSEIARWRQAYAMELWRAGDKSAALAQIEDSLRWDPTQADALACRGDWRLEAGEYQKAIDDYDEALQRNPRHVTARINRSVAFQHLGLHARAIADWKELLGFAQNADPRQRAVLLNGLAYAQALGQQDLEDALTNVDQALSLAGENAAMLDTRGYIRFLNGDFKAARGDLDLAVEQAEAEFQRFEARTDYLDQAEREHQLREYRRNLAVIRYHRALILESLDRPFEAEHDRLRVKNLGFFPGPDLF